MGIALFYLRDESRTWLKTIVAYAGMLIGIAAAQWYQWATRRLKPKRDE